MTATARKALLSLGFLAIAGAPALAQAPAQPGNPAAACGGDLGSFLEGVKAEAVAKGIPADVADRALAGAAIDQKVLSRDRAQGVFKQTFTEFSKRTVSKSRLDIGAQKMREYADVFARAEQEFGVPAPVITAFWAMETDFGAVQGDFNTRDALVTLAHDCRRPEMFRPQLLAAIEMVQHGDLDPAATTGAWAGEIGQVQMLPEDIIAYGVDGDGDGHVNLKKSSPDAILTAAKFIQSLGFKPGEPWFQEVRVPEQLPWEKTGLQPGMTAGDWFALGVAPRDGNTSNSGLEASLVLPQGRKGAAFLTYPNFKIYLEWNQSFIYTTSAAYFATRLAGAPPYQQGNPEPGLGDAEMKALQTRLQALGHDVGKIDGILGSGTRAALQKEQLKLGIPADGWATPGLLEAL
ncbi:lytic murein transglycosylase [Sinorhizobium meliloti]|uniref:lytic murein transglycosylase n=1 Tax=Rhizobium meliloti TaxID=382 RepID=UPI000FD52F4C|nr:lytic murein transglycosylase [Sinorhizobium meliloti]MDW9417271.1 lytic murein transglycosylase [Sinorhizobium meliloti]MDW9480152.1 lytic murein transglycosylase [Sinorhizobium meliloti]MDW9509787.1 lytic murein transglycosylase [Sinorhizobium meliloti]MDW9638852.1 lytic murein transglycosylase [Sinorhizobium meliloti]MDW9668272.1 lytic murein transglycosylase [Sinorhizobium meliloti]